jgi:hypothetical protein
MDKFRLASLYIKLWYYGAFATAQVLQQRSVQFGNASHQTHVKKWLDLPTKSACAPVSLVDIDCMDVIVGYSSDQVYVLS